MPSKPRDLRERLMEKAIVLGPDDCWEWTAGTNGKGYGRIWITEKRDKDYAHRVSYELAVGPIPAGLEIDHRCRNRACINPRHLEAVTRKVNQNRGFGVTGKNLRKTRCPKGHPFTEANTYRPPTGGRQCATCRADYQRSYKRAWRARRRAAGLPRL